MMKRGEEVAKETERRERWKEEGVKRKGFKEDKEGKEV